MKKVIISLLFLFLIIFLPPHISAQRYAECDACGYCLGREEPGGWDGCARCLYPQIAKASDVNPNPLGNQTLEIKGTERGIQVTPAPGKYYTQIGCIDTSLSSFSNPSASGGVLNFLLNNVIFPVVGVLAFFSLLYGAFLLMTAQGAYEQIQRGKSFLVGSLVGLLFTFGSIFIIRFIGGDILRIPFLQSSDITSSNMQEIKISVEKLATDTGKLPGGMANNICIHNQEVPLNSCWAGLVSTCNTTDYPGWRGPYLTVPQVMDQWNNPYYLDPDYFCRPDVKGCEGVNYTSSDGIGPVKIVRALVSFGPDSDENYCGNATSATSCQRKDKDNIVLILCQ